LTVKPAAAAAHDVCETASNDRCERIAADWQAGPCPIQTAAEPLSLRTNGSTPAAAQATTVERVAELSVDYARILSSLSAPLDPAAVGAALVSATAARYEASHPAGSALHEFQQSGATYLFDLASAAGLPQEDRTVAAWALTPAAVAKRDMAYQRGFPLAPRVDGSAVDRGHVIPHLSGGEFGPNIFRQDRALNRGWSEQGKRYRVLEREAAATPGSM
jgi:hypothetical protein